MKSFLSRLLNYGRVVWLLVALIGVNVGYLSYLAYFPFKTIEIKKQPFCVVNNTDCDMDSRGNYIHPHNPQLMAGDVLVYQVDYCRYTKVPSKTTRTLIGPALLTINISEATTDPGCRVVNVTNAVIPPYVPEGIYYLKITTCFQVSPLQNDCDHQYRTEDFKVIRKD